MSASLLPVQSCNALDHKIISGEGPCLVKAANIHFPPKWDPEGLSTVDALCVYVCMCVCICCVCVLCAYVVWRCVCVHMLCVYACILCCVQHKRVNADTYM